MFKDYFLAQKSHFQKIIVQISHLKVFSLNIVKWHDVEDARMLQYVINHVNERQSNHKKFRLLKKNKVKIKK